MCITKNEILELNDIIQHLNSCSSETERDLYLADAVEDVNLFIETLKRVNKSKLTKTRKKKEDCKKTEKYTEDMIIKLFEENNTENIVSQYTKQELTEMYLQFFSSKPLSSYDKNKIAQSIYHYIYTMNRTKALLG